MVARPGASMPAPLAIPPIRQPSPVTTVVLGRVSVVMMAWAAAGPPSRASAFAAAVDAAQQLVHRQPLADQAGGADRHVAGGQQQPGDRGGTHHGSGVLGGGVGVLEPGRAGTGVGPTGVEDDRLDHAGLEHLLAPQHRRGLDPVAGEDGGGGGVRPVVDDQRDIGFAGGLQPGGDPGSPESLGRSDAHDATPESAVMGRLRSRRGRPSPAGRASGWRSARPGRPRPCRGCRWR